jgi:hypothetical protein
LSWGNIRLRKVKFIHLDMVHYPRINFTYFKRVLHKQT